MRIRSPMDPLNPRYSEPKDHYNHVTGSIDTIIKCYRKPNNMENLLGCGGVPNQLFVIEHSLIFW